MYIYICVHVFIYVYTGGLQFWFLPTVEVKVRWSQKLDAEGEEGVFTLEMGGALAKYTQSVQRDYGSLGKSEVNFQNV